MRIIKAICDNDIIFNPIEVKKSFRIHRDHNIEKIEMELKNLADYYNRYKKIECNLIKEFNINKN